MAVPFVCDLELLQDHNVPLTRLLVYHLHTAPVPTDGNCTGTLGHIDPTQRGEVSVPLAAPNRKTPNFIPRLLRAIPACLKLAKLAIFLASMVVSPLIRFWHLTRMTSPQLLKDWALSSEIVL